jgi:hypothetical protein
MAQSAAATPVGVIQGDGPASPLDKQDVSTWGLVTGLTSDGFYLQDPIGDGDPATSDGIFVFTHDVPSVSVGECVQVAGEVAEYYAKTELNWLTTITPSTTCGAQAVMPVALPSVRPGDDPVHTWEPLEGMVVQLDAMNGFVQEPTKHFADGEEELAFLPAAWQRYFGPVHLFHDQAALSGLLYVSNLLGATLPQVQWGDLLQVEDGGLVGVLDYNFGKYQLLPLPGQSLTVTPNKTVQQALSSLADESGDNESGGNESRSDEYGICSFNLHGFGRGTEQFPDPADYDMALHQRAQFIASQLSGCTVIALQETGSPDDAYALAETLTAEHGLAYSALSLEGPASHEAEFPLTNSILVDAARVTVDMVDSVIGCTSQEVGIRAPGACPVDEHPVFDRPPLVAKLVISGTLDVPWTSAATIWVIDNHWKSKSGDEIANARLRAAQATAVAERVQTILAADPAAQIVVLGDFNDYYQGAAATTLQSATGLFQPYDWLPPLQRYTYNFNGAAQVLDQLLVTPNLASQLALVEIVHGNADAPAGVAQSDHDPVVMRVRPAGAAMVAGTLQWEEIEVSASDGSGTVVAQAMTDAGGDFRLWGLPIGSVTLQLHAPDWIVLGEPVQSVSITAGMVMPTMPTMPAVRHATGITGAWVALNTPWLAESSIPTP